MTTKNDIDIFLSGMQSSGNGILHLGNYIGAIMNWKNDIKKPNSLHYYMLADLHSITSNGKKDVDLNQSTLNQLAMYLACGISGENVKVFRQSDIDRYHEGLFWLLTCKTPMGWLDRMTQYKDKKNKKNKEMTQCGLYTYPILMACDILLYESNYVSVGDDQKQHIEFVTDIANRVNSMFDKVLFQIPKPIIKNQTRVMSLSDGTRKMSKSSANYKSVIFMNDSDEDIHKKIYSAKTDSIIKPYCDKENRPEVSNLINIASILSNLSIEDIEKQCSSSKELKDLLFEITVKVISPIRKKFNDLIKDELYLTSILKENSDYMSSIAKKVYDKVKAVFYS